MINKILPRNIIQSNSQVKTSSCKSFVWKNDFDEILLCLFFLFLLEFLLFLDEKLFLIVLQFFLQSFQLYVILFHSFLIVEDFLFHRDYLPLFLLQIILINGYHFFFFNGWLSLENLLQ